MRFGLAASFLGRVTVSTPFLNSAFMLASSIMAGIEKDFLVTHFMQHYQMIVGSLLTWRRVPDWLDSSALPETATTGVG